MGAPNAGTPLICVQRCGRHHGLSLTISLEWNSKVRSMPSSSHRSQSRIEDSIELTISPGSLLEWATAVLAPGGLSPAAHHRLLIQHLEATSRGEIDRLM